MVESLKQFEKNIQSSFGYVKKDLLMVNEAISDVHEKIQHLSINNATLLGELTRLSERIEKLESKGKPNKVKKAKVSKKQVKKSSKAKPVKKVVKETVTYS